MKKLTEWELWIYDVWGNKKDGFEVNDRIRIEKNYPIMGKVIKYNKGTDREFNYIKISNYAIKKAFGIGCKIETDGDDTIIYVNSLSGYPIGEMILKNPESLSYKGGE